MAKYNGLTRFFNNLVIVAISSATLAEATHYSEHHNPHGNRRERIAEQRERLTEAQRSAVGQRNITARSGGSPEPEPEVPLQVMRQVRRRYGSDTINNMQSA